jgi:hypothetical protein
VNTIKIKNRISSIWTSINFLIFSKNYLITIDKYLKFRIKIWKKVFFTKFLALIIEYSVKNLKKVIVTENWNSVKNAVLHQNQ